MLRIFIVFFAFMVANPLMADDPSGNGRWIDRKAEGWFWYKSPPETEQPIEEKAPEVTPPLLPTNPMAKQAPEPPAPLSSAWIRQNLQKYLDAAVDNPSPENVSAFLYIQKYAMDKSFAFMDASQEVTLGNSALDEISRRPTATFANRKLDEEATANVKQTIQKVSSNAGLFLFIDGSDSSNAQRDVLSMLQRSYRFDAVTIAAADISDDQITKDVRKDSGHAQQMGITSLPAIVLIRGDGVFDVISQAPVSYSDLQKRILVGAKRLGIITEDEFNYTRPITNITKSLVSIPEQQSSNASTVPIPASEIVKAFNGGF